MSSPTQAAPTDWSALLPAVTLEVRQAGARPVRYPLAEVDFLIGSLPGCDLRVGGVDSAAVFCLLARHPGGVTLRKLSSSQIILVNGRAASHMDLVANDHIQLAAVEIRVQITPAVQPVTDATELEQARQEIQESVRVLREQLIQFQQDKDAFEREKASFTPGQVATPDTEQQRRELEGHQQRYANDVIRLDRWQATLEEREKELTTAVAEAERLRDQLRADSMELEEQVRQVDEWRATLTDEAERLEKAKAEHAATARELTDRVASVEGQQATLSSIRIRLERMREANRVRQEQLDQQQADQDAREATIASKMRELEQAQLEMENQRQQYEQDREQWQERGSLMDAAVRQMAEAQKKLAEDDERVRQQAEENERRAAELTQVDSDIQGRIVQMAETRERLDAELNALRERSVNLLQREQACEALQEQLRRRSEEIDARHQELADQLTTFQTKVAELEEARRQQALREEEAQRQLNNWREDLDARALQLQKQHEELAGFEERYQEQINQIAADRRLLAEEQGQYHVDQRSALQKLAEERAEFEVMKTEAQQLIEQLPETELQANTALDRLSTARTQMREHLSEIHGYVRQCRDELENVRGRLQADLDRLHEEEETLRRGQDEHRHAMATFRQQLIDWQGQIAELRRLLARDETRLEHKKVQADERARAIEAESERLAKQAEVLQEQEREVADRRQAMDQHLVDLRDWYRRKLRDLAGVALTPDVTQMPTHMTEAVGEDGELAIVPVGRSILALGGAADPGDQKLGDILRDSQLIDADTLTALLAEARRQRRSLRQVLLASGVITLYQLALIEAGNMQGLMLGPVRVVDRLRHNTMETVYRVFDPRRGAEAVLRHLSEACSADPTRAAEFRQHFEAARLNDPHLANTLEVFDLLARPAVLQEWLVGLPATDWPPLTAAPGVCYRLLTQAAQGLAAAHQAGVVHGRLSDAMLLLTGEGILKIIGIGDPAWLVGITHDEEPTPRDDLRMLGTIVSGWCTPTGVRKGAKTKPLPDALVSVLYRLAADGGAGYHDVRELLLDLEKAGSAIPPNAEAWDRLLKYVREHGATEALMRQSA